VNAANFRERVPLSDTYDAIIFIEETTPSRLRPF
jgi:erythromycin esterase-like protein